MSDSSDYESSDSAAEHFGMFEKDPVHKPSNEYLSRLQERVSDACCRTMADLDACEREFMDWHGKLLIWREAAPWFGPSSSSYRFVDDFFDGFEFPDKTELDKYYGAWESPTRREMEFEMSKLKRASFTFKGGLFGQTLNKFIWETCRGWNSRNIPICIDLPPSTKENPIPARIANDIKKGFQEFWPMYLVGHDTVLKAKKDAPIFYQSVVHDDQINAMHQVVCFDITFIGPVFAESSDKCNGFHEPRFYGCSFANQLNLHWHTILINCRGGKVVIDSKNLRLVDCQFDEVLLIDTSRLLAQNSVIGKLTLEKEGQSRAAVFP